MKCIKLTFGNIEIEATVTEDLILAIMLWENGKFLNLEHLSLDLQHKIYKLIWSYVETHNIFGKG